MAETMGRHGGPLTNVKCNRRKWRLSILIILVTCVTTMYFFRNSTSFFIEPIERAERERMVELVKRFDQITTENNLTYILWGGSLIGSFRHHGIIPWDDDMDVLMNVSQRPDIQKHLSNQQDYKLYVHPFAWKFYHKDATYIEGKAFRWPYVDIFFFSEDATHIWAIESTMTAESYLPKNKVFPLRRRRFETLFLQTPCDPKTALSYFDINRCINSRYSHKFEYWKPIHTWSSVPCRQLEDRYRFVRHTRINSGWNETLEFNGVVLHYEIVSFYC